MTIWQPASYFYTTTPPSICAGANQLVPYSKYIYVYGSSNQPPSIRSLSFLSTHRVLVALVNTMPRLKPPAFIQISLLSLVLSTAVLIAMCHETHR